MSDIPTQQTIKIGKGTVGLIGLEAAFNQLAGSKDLSEKEAADFLFAAVKKQNYIPAAAEKMYKQALLREYKKRRGENTAPDKRLKIRILGPGCVSCNRLGSMLYDILQDMHIPADIEQVHDLDEIWRFGVLTTPALIINEETKCAGRMPSRAEVEGWLREMIDSN